MWRKYGVGLGLAALVAVMIAREWLVRSEISTLQTEIQANIRDQFSAVSDETRLDHLSAAPTVYERFLEPVILKTNKLISPFSRSDILTAWRKDVHQLIEDEIYKVEVQIKESVNKNVAEIQKSQDPSIARLMKIVEEKTRTIGRSDIQDAIKSEIQNISTFAGNKDKETLGQIKIQGRESLALLKSKLQKLTAKGLGDYVASGKFTQEIIEPVTALIFKLRQEETRRQTWAEFNRSLEDSLSKRKARLAENSKRMDQENKIASDAKKFEKLFNQLAKTIDSEETRAQAAPTQPKSADNPASLDYDDSSSMTQ